MIILHEDSVVLGLQFLQLYFFVENKIKLGHGIQVRRGGGEAWRSLNEDEGKAGDVPSVFPAV